MYLVARDITHEKQVEETLRRFLLTTRHVWLACAGAINVGTSVTRFTTTHTQPRPAHAVSRHGVRE
jgi:hypothetical protein